MAHMISTKDYDLNVDLLNHRINTFNYEAVEIKNKPSPNLSIISLRDVTTHHKLQERAVQTWCLFRISPFLVSDEVPVDDPYLKHILNLNRINEIVFTPKLRSSILPYLHELIKHHHEEFRRLLPKRKPINKLHHMSHYPLCMEKSGPLKDAACFMFEAEHLMFKRYRALCCNFKNITKSMSNICQMSQCSVQGTKKNPIGKKN